MFRVPEECRILKHPTMGSDKSFGNNGAFIIPFFDKKKAIAVASDGEGWEHVSVVIKDNGAMRVPTWSEMCRVKDVFWGDEDAVIQFHPKESEYVNNHPHVLHLWRPIGIDFPRPDKTMVGVK